VTARLAAMDAVLAEDTRRRRRGLGWAGLLLAAAVVALAVTGFFDAERFAGGLPALAQLGSEMIPPNFERWQLWLTPLRDTLAMSVAGTALTMVLSLPLAPWPRPIPRRTRSCCASRARCSRAVARCLRSFSASSSSQP